MTKGTLDLLVSTAIGGSIAVVAVSLAVTAVVVCGYWCAVLMKWIRDLDKGEG